MLAKSASADHIDLMNSRQLKTLKAVFKDPVSVNIRWRDIESLLVAVGCDVIEGKGSGVKFVSQSRLILRVHRPHPEPEAKRYQVRDARDFLEKIGVTPE